VTGLLTQAFALVGTQSVLIATAEGRTRSGPVGLATKAPLYATACGRAIAVQLSAERLDALLPAEPFPDARTLIAAMTGTSAEPMFSHPGDEPTPTATATLARTRRDLEAQLDAIRQERYAFDFGALDPAIHCIAISWPHPALPAAISCLGPADLIEANAGVLRRVLAAGAAPGATPQSIVSVAAA